MQSLSIMAPLKQKTIQN